MRRLRRTQHRHTRANRRFGRRVVTWTTATALSLAAQATWADPPVASPADAHQTAVAADADGDLLADREETALGYRPSQSDQDCSGTVDGAELAVRCAQAIAELPLNTETTSPDQIHKEEWLVFGSEACSVCGEIVNMGSLRIINPPLGLRLDVPFVAVHCMEHGALGYSGDVNQGRVDIAKLAQVLGLRFPCKADVHQLPLDYVAPSGEPLATDVNDLDNDALADSEELAAGLNLYDADQDENLVPDGIQLAKRCAEAIDALPTADYGATDIEGIYKISYMMRGLEWCEACGLAVNMGYWLIVNAETGASMEVSEIARHAMEHGSFSYVGTLHTGRADVAALLEILGLPAGCGDLGIPYDPADLNQDCKVDTEDFTEFAERWLDSIEPTKE